MPAVSIIIPCFNGERFLTATLQSVVSQTYLDWECIVVDDGSTDSTAQIGQRSVENDSRFRLISQTNHGLTATRNRGLQEAAISSRYVIWLDSDDVWDAEFLEVMVAQLDRNLGVGLAFCNRRHIDESGTVVHLNWKLIRWAPTRFWVRAIPDDEPLTPFSSLFVQDAVTNPSSSLFRKETCLAVGKYNESMLQPGEDWDFVFRVALVSQVHFVNRTLVSYRQHSGQFTAGSSEKMRRGYDALYAAWAAPQGLTEAQRNVVRAANRFRDGRARPHQWLGYGMREMAAKHPTAAFRCFAIAARDLARFSLRSTIGRS